MKLNPWVDLPRRRKWWIIDYNVPDVNVKKPPCQKTSGTAADPFQKVQRLDGSFPVRVEFIRSFLKSSIRPAGARHTQRDRGDEILIPRAHVAARRSRALWPTGLSNDAAGAGALVGRRLVAQLRGDAGDDSVIGLQMHTGVSHV